MCYTCDDKGYFSSRCRDGRGPARRGHQSVQTYSYENIELPSRPVPSSRVSSHQSGISHIPAGITARGISSNRHSGSSSHHAPGSLRSVPTSSTHARSIVSELSRDTIQESVDEIRSLEHFVRDLRGRFDRVVLMRKQLSHKTKKISDKEYEQQLNSPSNLVLYEQYKQTEVESARLKQVAMDYKGNFHHNYTRATEEQHMTIHVLLAAWANGAMLSAERRMEFMYMFPFACMNKAAIEGHIKAVEHVLSGIGNALYEMKSNQESICRKFGQAAPVGAFD